MTLFDWFRKLDKSDASRSQPEVGADDRPMEIHELKSSLNSKSARTTVYSVRVGEHFKDEVRSLQSELQREQLHAGGKPRRVTEGAIMEMMLAAFKDTHKLGGAVGQSAPIREEVWYALRLIAHRQQLSPSEAFEQLVIEKASALGLVQRK